MRAAPSVAPASPFACRQGDDRPVRGFRGRKASPRAARVCGRRAARYTGAMMTGSSRGTSCPASGVPRARVLLVTGMSGAGRSTALKTLEDMGYEAFDNLPLSLVPALVESIAADARAIAVGADLRTRGFAIESMLEPLDAVVGRTGRELKVLFIDCDDEPLRRPYTET